MLKEKIHYMKCSVTSLLLINRNREKEHILGIESHFSRHPPKPKETVESESQQIAITMYSRKPAAAGSLLQQCVSAGLEPPTLPIKVQLTPPTLLELVSFWSGRGIVSADCASPNSASKKRSFLFVVIKRSLSPMTILTFKSI